MTAKVNSLNSQVSTLTAKVDSLNTQISTLTKEKADLTAKVNSLTKERDDLKAKVASQQESIRGQSSEIQSLQGQVSNLKSENTTLNTKVSAMAQTISKLEADNKSLKSQVSSLNTRVSSLTEENKNLKSQIPSSNVITTYEKYKKAYYKKLASEKGLYCLPDKIIGSIDSVTITETEYLNILKDFRAKTPTDKKYVIREIPVSYTSPDGKTAYFGSELRYIDNSTGALSYKVGSVTCYTRQNGKDVNIRTAFATNVEC